jgi:hypothetical protein
MAKTALIQGASCLSNSYVGLPPQELAGETQGRPTIAKRWHTGRSKPDGISPIAMGAHTTNPKPKPTARRTIPTIYRGAQQSSPAPLRLARQAEKNRSGATLKVWVRREEKGNDSPQCRVDEKLIMT